MKVVVLSSHTTSLFWFRMDMMKDFIEKGHSVIAFGSEPEDKWKDKFAEFKIDYRQLHVERNGLNPLKDLRTFFEILRFMKKEKPDKVFTYQAKTIVYGTLAAKCAGIREVYTLIAGLGGIFMGAGLKKQLIRQVMKIQYKLAFAASKLVFFQNNDDRQELIRLKLLKQDKTKIIHGSGVNLTKFQPADMPDTPTVLFIGRLIREKGLIEYLTACEVLKKKHPNYRFLLVGPYDTNLSAIKEADLQPYIDQGIVEYFGEQTDVRPYIEQCSVFTLPTYHEGTPKTVLEAMAMQRAIVTCDAPGCRETVTNGLNGYLVPIKNVIALSERLEKLLENRELCEKMGQASLKIAREKYDVKLVNQSIMEAMSL